MARFWNPNPDCIWPGAAVSLQIRRYLSPSHDLWHGRPIQTRSQSQSVLPRSFCSPSQPEFAMRRHRRAWCAVCDTGRIRRPLPICYQSRRCVSPTALTGQHVLYQRAMRLVRPNSKVEIEACSTAIRGLAILTHATRLRRRERVTRVACPPHCGWLYLTAVGPSPRTGFQYAEVVNTRKPCISQMLHISRCQ